MNVHRNLVTAAALCLSGACVAACSAGIVSARPHGSGSPGSGSPAPANSPSSPPATASLPPVSVSHTVVGLGGMIGNFPIPTGAELFEKVISGKTIDLVLSAVTAAQVSSFYGSALPRDGYKITENTVGTGIGFSGTSIEFTGHGYKGTIGAVSGISGSSGNLIGITLKPQ
jgi:hypothetical protein